MKRESNQASVVPHPSIKRHGTSIRFSDHTRPTLRTTQSNLDRTQADKGKEGTCESTFEVSVELESCVSTLELIQLPMDKTGRHCVHTYIPMGVEGRGLYYQRTDNRVFCSS